MKSRAGKRQREETVQKRKDQKKEDADARKGRKVAIHCVFPMIWGSGGSKSRLAKAAGAEAAGQMGDEKVHAVVARSTFPSQNVQNTATSDHFWKLRCRKSARRCGAKHMSKSKCTKHSNLGPLLEVEMSKKCMPLWCEAHFQVKMYKTHQVRTTFVRCDVEKVHAVVARSTFPSENVQSTTCSDHFWRLRCRLSKKCTPLWREAHFEVKMYKTHHVRSTFGGSDVDFRKSARTSPIGFLFLKLPPPPCAVRVLLVSIYIYICVYIYIIYIYIYIHFHFLDLFCGIRMHKGPPKHRPPMTPPIPTNQCPLMWNNAKHSIP